MECIATHTIFFSGRGHVLFLLDPTRSKKFKGEEVYSASCTSGISSRDFVVVLISSGARACDYGGIWGGGGPANKFCAAQVTSRCLSRSRPVGRVYWKPRPARGANITLAWFACSWTVVYFKYRLMWPPPHTRETFRSLRDHPAFHTNTS